MKIKFRYIYTMLSIMLATSTLVSCQDMLDTDSDRLAFEDDHTIGSPNDSVYSVMGILSQLQKVGERYVLFGELRGDLMTASDNASVDIKGVNNFQIGSENAYKEKYDYYSIINNCNYAITRMDTSITVNMGKVMMPEFVAIKAIRAWVYMQMVQSFGKASYLEKPILSLEGSLAEYPEVDMDGLADLLIADLRPYVNVRPLDYGQIDEKSSARFFIPIRMLLGDLYLYQNKYEQAAQMYYDQIIAGPYYMAGSINRWTKSTQDEYEISHTTNSYYGEVLTMIPYSKNVKDFHSNLIKLSYSNNPSVLPVQNFIDKMSRSVYFYAVGAGQPISAYLEGDLRGSLKGKWEYDLGDAYEIVPRRTKERVPLIKRFYNSSIETSATDPDPNALDPKPRILTAISIYNIQQLYLRYAEAVNRAGKPTLAFSVLKYGLGDVNMHNPAMVNPSEIVNMEPYINFRLKTEYDKNIGTASRGRGLGISRDVALYIIPNYTRLVGGAPSTNDADIYAARQDSINWVESAILDELAAETAFNGNRFFDLLRMSRRRANHPEFMAEKVAAKYSDPAGMKNRLKNMDAWYIK